MKITLQKMFLLFSLGLCCGVLSDYLLQHQQLIYYYPRANKLSVELFVYLSTGFSACFIGLIYPLLDEIFEIRIETSWIKVIRFFCRDLTSSRCCGTFVGLNYAISKYHFFSGLNNFVLMLSFSLCVWYAFDRTIHGGISSRIIIGLIGIAISSIGTSVTSSLVDQGFYRFSRSLIL